MKNVVLLVGFLVGVFSFGQDLPNFAPISPNAVSIGKFGSFPVNTNLGTTNISIPLYTIEQGDIKIPISLSYNATSGIRVNDEASWVGLGWTLHAGGAIVRGVKGQPSTEDIPDINTTLDFNNNNYTYLNNVARGLADTSQDVYFFNALGYSGQFIYDQVSQNFKFFDYQPIKVINEYIPVPPYPGQGNVFSGYSFKAYLENGLQLEFAEYEAVNHWANSTLYNDYRQYKTASFLSKVVSSDGIDEITFEYDSSIIEKNMEIQGDYIRIYTSTAQSNNIPIISPAYTSFQKTLRKINFKNGYVLFDYSLDRIDSDSPKLNNIMVYSSLNGVDKLINKISFDYVYYSRTGGKTYSTSINNYEPNKYHYSLKLNSVSIYNNTSAPQSYSFEYNTTKLSTRKSSGQDFWGYSNTNNHGFVHNRTTNAYNAFSTVDVIYSVDVGDGDRSANEAKTKAGILTKITYPTGGYTVFEYEANKYLDTEIIPQYEQHAVSVYSEGEGGTCTPTGLNSKTFTLGNSVQNASLTVSFSHALDGNANNSYGEFDGQRYYRDPATSEGYPETTHTIDLNLLSNSTHTISAMEYGIGYLGATGCPFVYTTVSWDEITGYVTQTTEKLAGGLRIQSITSFDGISPNYISRKEFEYEGVRQLIPIILGDYQTYSHSRAIWVSTGDGLNCELSIPAECNNLVFGTPAYDLNTNGGPSVEYLKVTEIDIDQFGNDNGKIIKEYEPTTSYLIMGENPGAAFRFFKHSSYVPDPGYYVLKDHGFGNFSNYLTKNWTSGSLKKIEFYKRNSSDDYVIQKSVENTYNQVNEINIPVNYVDDIITSGSLVSCGVYVTDFSTNDYRNAVLIYNTGYFSLGKKLLGSSKKTLFDTNGENPLITTTNFFYDNVQYLQLTRTETTDSQQNSIESKTYYPQDRTQLTGLGTTAFTAATSLEAQHRIATPIQIETYKNDELLTTQRSNYKDWGQNATNTGNIIALETVETAKREITATNPLEPRITYHKYDTHGNPLEVSKAESNAHIVYIWGYNHTQPIAKIVNATWSEVESHVTNLQLLSNQDDDRTIGSAGNEGALRTALNTLRNALPNTQVTTYTYDPLIGVTSITQPNGETEYYEYDNFNRLKFIKNSEGKILKENEYHYRD